MELNQVLADRWSCRAFLPEEVPETTLLDVFAVAQQTASWCNTQPWQVHLVTGEATHQLAKGLLEHVVTQPSVPDLPMPERYVGSARERRRGAGFALYSAVGIGRDDMAARGEQMLKNYSFFGAPHVAIVTTDSHLGLYGAVDCGGYVTNLLNAALDRGVASLAQAAIAMYSDHVRRFLDLPQDRSVLCAVSLGWPDLEHPANRFRTDRAPLDDVVTVVR